MTDIGVNFDDKKATQGMAEGNPEALQNVHDPGREGTKVSLTQRCTLVDAPSALPETGSSLQSPGSKQTRLVSLY